MTKNGKKILVTGGAGFIASHIADKYISLGHKVIVVDNLSFGKKENVNKKAKFYKADVKNKYAMSAIFKKEKPNIVNHHAAMASIVLSTKNPVATIEDNALATHYILDLCNEYGVKKFIFSSTGGGIYSSPKKFPVNEKEAPSPISIYGLSKLMAEEYIKFHNRVNHIPYTILRYANVYGPRQNPKGEAGVVAIFSYNILRKKSCVIYGDGTKFRDYVYVDDVIKANVLALNRGTKETINISWGKKITDYEVFKTISNALNNKIPPVYADFREEEVLGSSLDNRKSEKILGWKPKISFREGVQKTTDYYKKLLK